MLASRHTDLLGLPFHFRGETPCWPEPAPTPASCVREAEPIDALEDDALSRRFRSWRGRSGHRYVFSVFDPSKCPAYGDAALIVVAVDRDGTRRPLAFLDTGPFPEPLLSQWAADGAAPDQHREFHLHLLARTAAERRVILEDLRAAV